MTGPAASLRFTPCPLAGAVSSSQRRRRAVDLRCDGDLCPSCHAVAARSTRRVHRVKIVVAPHITAVHEGTVYRPGDVVELPMPIAYGWIGSGWAVEVD
jgi:hypothetical protein